MQTIPLFEAKNRLSEILARVERGEEFTITRHDHAVAKLIPVNRPSREDVKRTIAAIKKLRDSNRAKVTREELAAWKTEGRP